MLESSHFPDGSSPRKWCRSFGRFQGWMWVSSESGSSFSFVKCWSSCAGTTCRAAVLRQTLLLNLRKSSMWELTHGALAKQRGNSTVPHFWLFTCSALSTSEDGRVCKQFWQQVGRRWGPILLPAEVPISPGCGHSVSLLHKQLPSPEPERSKERPLSRALCPWQGVSVYIDIFIK